MAAPAISVYASYELASPLTPDEIWSRLEPELEPLVSLRVTLPFAAMKPYEGERSASGFRFKRLYHKSQHSTPLTHVECVPTPAGTTLQVRVQRTPMSSPIVPALFVGIACAFVVLSFVLEAAPLLLVSPMPALAGLAVWGISRLTLQTRAREDRAFLESRLA